MIEEKIIIFYKTQALKSILKGHFFDFFKDWIRMNLKITIETNFNVNDFGFINYS